MSDLTAAAVPLDITVRFAETDLMGVVHHSVYVVWFEAGRVAWMEAAGVPYTRIAASGHHFAVTGIEVRYRAAARFGDPVQVVTRLTDLHSRRVRFVYEVRSADDQTLLATGSSEHICVDDDGRTTRIPSWATEGLRKGMSALAAVGGCADGLEESSHDSS
jgi:acyl-CoA thioester hydrolase